MWRPGSGAVGIRPWSRNPARRGFRRPQRPYRGASLKLRPIDTRPRRPTFIVVWSGWCRRWELTRTRNRGTLTTDVSPAVGSKLAGGHSGDVHWKSRPACKPIARLSRRSLAIGKPVAFDANAEDRDTLGFISMTTRDPVFRMDGELECLQAAGCRRRPRCSTAIPTSRICWNSRVRSASLSEATVTESPVVHTHRVDVLDRAHPPRRCRCGHA